MNVGYGILQEIWLGIVLDQVCKNIPYNSTGVCICRIRVPYPFQWGAPSFDAGEAFAMMVTTFVALVEVCAPPHATNRITIMHCHFLFVGPVGYYDHNV